MNKLLCVGLSFWKKIFIQKYLKTYKCIFMSSSYFNKKFSKHISIKSNDNNFLYNNSLAFWASTIIRDQNINLIEKEYQKNAHSSDKQSTVLHIEDGFIRSNGLGSNFYYPYSLVIDKTGIYYDPKNSCDLEKILYELANDLDNEEYLSLFERANSLKELIIKNNISKYSVGNSNNSIAKLIITNQPLDNQSLNRFIRDYNEFIKKASTNNNNSTNEKKIIFVPAQVDDDASIVLGGCGYSNISLLREVRKNNPNSFIIFKIHPDALSGNRECEINIKEVLSLANYICTNELTNIDCINLCNEVHTISSLAGFEALIRNKKVYCYGMPFYAGYGLTVDISVEKKHPIALESYSRRNKINLFSVKSNLHRHLSSTDIGINNLIIGSLILYPTYYNWDKKCISTVEDIIDTLLQKSCSKQNKLCYWFSKLTKPFRKNFLNTNNLLEQYQIKENYFKN